MRRVEEQHERSRQVAREEVLCERLVNAKGVFRIIARYERKEYAKNIPTHPEF